MTKIELNEEFLKVMIMKLLSFMNDEQLERVHEWLKESNINLEDLGK